ncbi:MAG: hypothetical protein Q8N77_01415 [Nanoarchaeota archaeon]|nr:hypothetical protein [Nanoarchaeota archaeon]
MTTEAIEQAAKTIIEIAYEYETALQQKDKKKAEQTKAYILKVCDNLKRTAKEERKNE